VCNCEFVVVWFRIVDDNVGFVSSTMRIFLGISKEFECVAH
jgi:hypothetical protein